MKDRHANDLELHTLAFEPSECTPHITEHIHTCVVCNQKVEAYTLLSASLNDQPAPTLDYNLSELVLEQLPSQTERTTIFDYLINSTIIASVVLAISTLYLVKDSLHYLLSGTLNIQSFFMISIVAFISLPFLWETYILINKKIKMLDA